MTSRGQAAVIGNGARERRATGKASGRFAFLKRLTRPFLLLLVTLSLVLGACSKTSAEATRYHCPMHPTYVSDKPGDCPICGMRLVPIEEGKSAPAADAASDRSPTSPPPAASASTTTATGPREHKLLYYRNPMDPKVTSPVPMKDPMGMDYVPVYADEPEQGPAAVAGLAPVDVNEEGMRLAGVRTAVAERSTLARTVRTVGTIVPDETRVRHVHTKISGWVDKLYVNFTGEAVKRGSPILSIYSQELLSSQEEYLRARDAASRVAPSTLPEVRQASEQMLEAARRRLTLFDVPSGFIKELDRTGVPKRSVTLSAPSSGIVTGKSIFEGQQVDPGTELFTVTDLSQVWIEADFYENEANAVKVGQEAKLTLAYDPGVQMTGKVKYVYPYLNQQSRTLKVRFEFPNPGLALKLWMYANVELPIASSEGVVVPDSAVMDTGVRQVVFVSPREGRFEPRLVKVGVRGEGKVEILSGVSAGERVVVKANFLIDSESQLRAAISAPAVAPASSEAAP